MHYTDVMNLHLERAGVEIRLHPDRLEARGVVRAPEPRLSPADSQAFKQGGVITEAMQRVMDHRATHATAKALEQRVARVYWEARRQELGLAQEMPLDRALRGSGRPGDGLRARPLRVPRGYALRWAAWDVPWPRKRRGGSGADDAPHGATRGEPR